MTLFTSGYVADDSRSLSTKNVGLKLTTFYVNTITDVTFSFSGSNSAVLRCYVQTSDGTISQIGSDYSYLNTPGSHTFDASSSPVTIDTDNFILFIYFVSGSNVDVEVQYSGSTSGIGTEVYYSPKTTTPTYGSWSASSCPGTCGVPLTMNYETGGSGGTVLLPPPVAMVNL